MDENAVVLLSGGLDSATTLAMAQSQGYICYALPCLYGQQHSIELQAAERIAQTLGTQDHRLVS